MKVVPRLVEHNAAPAAKHWRYDAPRKLCKMNESPIGATMPVMATPVETAKFALRLANDVERPPRVIEIVRIRVFGLESPT